VFPRIGYIETLEAAKAHPHYTAPLGKLQGRGVASGFWFNAAVNRAPRSTSPRTATSSSPRAIRISAARALRSPTFAPSCSASITAACRADRRHRDHRFSNLTGGSRVLFASAMVVTQSTDKVIATLRERAAKIWEIDRKR